MTVLFKMVCFHNISSESSLFIFRLFHNQGDYGDVTLPSQYFWVFVENHHVGPSLKRKKSIMTSHRKSRAIKFKEVSCKNII